MMEQEKLSNIIDIDKWKMQGIDGRSIGFVDDQWLKKTMGMAEKLDRMLVLSFFDSHKGKIIHLKPGIPKKSGLKV